MITKSRFVNGRRVSRDLLMLYEMGVEPFEIEYLLHLKRKEDIRKRWKYH